MEFDYVSNALGCTEEEAKLGFLTTQELLSSKENNLKLCTFLNKTDYPYICIYNSIYTDLDNDDDDLPTKILRLSLVFPAILRFNVKSEYVKEWVPTKNEYNMIFDIINNNWESIRKKYLISYLSIYDKCINIPMNSPYINIDGICELYYIDNKHFCQ